jgi:hypothetical protein
MSQHDFDIANQTAASARSDINNALQALASLSSGDTAPSTTYANMLWYETDTNILKMRNEANSDWINVGYLDQGSSAFRILDDTQVMNTGGTQTGLLGDQATATWEAGSGTTDGQTWQSVSRSGGVTYQNTTGKPIMVAVEDNQGNYSPYQVSTDGSNWVTIGRIGANSQHSFSFIVPNGHYYRNANSGITPEVWAELR